LFFLLRRELSLFSELGPIPKGWSIRKVEDILIFNRFIGAFQPQFDRFFDHLFRVLRRFALADDA